MIYKINVPDDATNPNLDWAATHKLIDHLRFESADDALVAEVIAKIVKTIDEFDIKYAQIIKILKTK